MKTLPLHPYSLRLSAVRDLLKKKKIDGFLITDIHCVRYLTGFSGSSGLLLITEKDQIFLTDFRYKEYSEREIREWDIYIEKGNRIKTVRNLVRKTGIKTLGFESSISFEFYQKLSRMGFNIKPFRNFCEKIREIKDTAELHLIREAIRRAESAFLKIKPYIKIGIQERTIALRLEEKLKKNGCRQIPFDIIVAAGPNSAMPHARSTDRRLAEGDLVIIDWGGEANGYFSDITRTLVVKGDNLHEKRKIYQLVLEANRKAISQVTPGVKSQHIDHSARNIIKRAGYGDFFGHGTGHGVGIQVHESPRIIWSKKDAIKENMVFTIEPGIYIPGLGGVRIEDMVVVRKKGVEVLTSLPKKLEIV